MPRTPHAVAVLMALLGAAMVDGVADLDANDDAVEQGHQHRPPNGSGPSGSGALGTSGSGSAPTASRIAPTHPNILFVLLDDQDQVLGGASHSAMPSGLPALTARGATLSNWFANTPVCACSRAEILTGRYFHNLVVTERAPLDVWDRQHNTYGPCSPFRRGGACGPPESAPGFNMHLNFSLLAPGPTVASHLAAVGYRVGIFGKYLNRVPVQPDGRPLVPDGVHTFFVSPGDEANKSSALDASGEYYPSFYYVGAEVWNNTELEYETAFLGNRSLAWMRNATADKVPWLLYLAPHAPHGLALPAPWYAGLEVNTTAPRTPSWNYSAKDHHWLIAQQPPLTTGDVRGLDRVFQQRWRCLRAVDDMIAALTREVDLLGVGDSTYIFATSDNGFHLGELRLGEGKWNVYDTDVRLPMRVAGPGIKPGVELGLVGSHVDLAPTWLGLAGIDTPPDMDGRSRVAALVSPGRRVPRSVRRHLAAPTPARSPGTIAESGGHGGAAGVLPVGGALIEYHSLGMTGLNSRGEGRLGDAWNNTYRALRVIDRRDGGLGNVLYAEFGDFTFSTITFREYYDVEADPWQLENIVDALPKEDQAAWAQRLAAAHGCRGAGCRA